MTDSTFPPLTTRWPPIAKGPQDWCVAPNLLDYQRTCAEFSWSDARSRLDGLPAGRGLNIAHEAVDRHAAGGRRDRVALRWLSRDGARRDFTYADLRDETNRFANILKGLGVGRGDPVAVLAGRIPELYIAALGTLKNGSVFTPLFSAFGPEPIQSRINIASAKVLVTTEALYRKKVEALRRSLPSLEHVLLVGDASSVQKLSGVRHLGGLMAEADRRFIIPVTDPEDRALLHFTSGTTGKPKGAIHVHQAVVAHHATAHFALDFHADDVFWCTADPGWVTGTSYGIIAPLTHGLMSIVDEADFDAERWYSILSSEHVTVWYTAPTAIRMLMKVGAAAARQHACPSLRLLTSVGEPLNPEAVVWGVDAFDKPFHDNWWQTETGGIMIANFAAMEVRPGSMGRPLPGIEAAIVRRTGENAIEVVKTPDTEGELALQPGWPSMFRGYLSDEERYRKGFVGGY
jgi:acetyl-CoA synthetase